MPFASAPDGVRIYYEESGKGDPLLLIVGRASDHHLWNSTQGDFAKNYRLIVYDQRGTGQSDKPEEPPYTVQGFARDAVAILDHLGIARTHVYGASMGGAIGQWFGIEHADRLGALVLACSSPGDAHGVRRSQEIHRLILEGDNFKVLDTFFSTRRALPAFFISMRESAKYPVPEYADRLHAMASEAHNSWERLPAIKAPTLILQGTDDPVVPAANAQLLADRIPGAEIHMVRRGRHMFFVEFRKEVDRVVLEFLRCHPLNV